MAATILLVDSDTATRETMRRMLDESNLDLDVREASGGDEALPLSLSGDVDVVITRLDAAGVDGLSLLRSIRAECDADSLPVVIVTKREDDDAREMSFAAGVNDFLCHPFSPVELVSRIHVQLRLKRLQQELRRTNESYRRLGSQDELTGLGNRRSFLETCHRELARSRRHGFAMTVAVVDIDHFRKINMADGHLVGDAIIADLSMLLQRELRTHDVVARLGGERFGALLPQTDAEPGRRVCERVVQHTRDHSFPGHNPGDLTVSIGCATYPGANLESVDELMNAAQASLDRAKAASGSRVEAWSDYHRA